MRWILVVAAVAGCSSGADDGPASDPGSDAAALDSFDSLDSMEPVDDAPDALDADLRFDGSDAGPDIPGPDAIDAGPDTPDTGPDVPDAGPDIPDDGPDVADAGPDIPDPGPDPDEGPPVPDAVPDSADGEVVEPDADADDAGDAAETSTDLCPDDIDCDDGDPCTVDTCEPASGCVHEPVALGCAACPADSQCLEEPCAIDMLLGFPDNGAVEAAAPNADIEIVQGPQGGVHVEVALNVDITPEGGGSTIVVDAELTTHLGCCDSEPVAWHLSPAMPLYNSGSGYVSAVIPVIFEQTIADPYVGKTCCVTARLSVGETEGSVSHTFSCVDWF